MNATDTYSRLTIDASALQPGDIVLTDTGDRAYAAFDTDQRGETVTVWTATSDQAKGVTEKLTLRAGEELSIARRDGGLRTTRVALP